MAFSGDFNNEEVMSEINMTPLVDVMLVLLIIFMVTLPVITHSVNIDLPKVNSTVSTAQPESVYLSVTDSGNIYWNDDRLTKDELRTRLNYAATLNPQAAFQLRGARLVAYEKMVEVMAMVQTAGIVNLGFVTEVAQ